MRRLVTAAVILGLLAGGEARAAIRPWLVKFAGVESRYLGSPGHKMTLNEVERAFRSFGLKEVRREAFTIVAPWEEEVWIQGPGLARTRLHTVWPNHVQFSSTPRQGLTGPLIDGGRGKAASFDGSPVEESIALVQLPCESGPQGWITPFILGVEAVIFLPPPGGRFTRTDAQELFLSVAADLPRFWAPSAAVAALKDAAARHARVTLRSRGGWREIKTWNIRGVLPGSGDPFPGSSEDKWRDKRVIFQSFTDSMSVVPALAPGGEQAGGVAALLEMARHFSLNPVPPTLMFLATSGHHHALSGTHEFLVRHIRSHHQFTRSITAEEKIEADYFIGLDLTSGDSRVASFSQGTFYDGWEHNLLAQNSMIRLARLLDVHAEKLYGGAAGSRYLNGVSPPTRAWKDLLGYPAAFDAEAAIHTGTPALTLSTPFDARMRSDTPLDTLDRVDVAALQRQVDTLKALFSSALPDPKFFGLVNLELPDRGRALRATVHEYERTITGLPDKPVPGVLVAVRSGKQAAPRKCYGSVRGLYTIFSDEDDPATMTATETGKFRIPIARTDEFWSWVHVPLEGYVFDEDGRIMMAADLGPLNGEQFNPDVWFNEREKETLLVIHRFKPLTILEPVDARQLRFLDGLTVRDSRDQPFMNFGHSFVLNQSKAQESFTPALVIFAPQMSAAEPRVKALLTSGSLGLKGIFTGADEALLEEDGKNIDEDNSRGSGYPIGLRTLSRAPFEAAKDMWVLDEYRGRTLKKHHVHNYRVEALHLRALAALKAARKAWGERRYEDFLTQARTAWGLEARAYPEFRAVANDLVRTVVFFCVLLLPFAFSMERLLFAYSDLRRQLLGTGGIFLLGFLALRQVHPAFRISSNPIIIFLGFIILALGLIVLGIVSSKFQRELRRMKGERGDYESVDIGRVSATLAAVTLGLSNLRKRPLRTALTVMTVMVLTFTVLSLVSMTSTISFFRLSRGIDPPYTGGLVREAAWQVLQPPVEKYVTSSLSGVAHVVPRSWVTARQRDEALQLEVTSLSGETTVVSALLGLSAGERYVLKPQRSIGLKGRWIGRDELDVCLLPEKMTKRLGVRIGERVLVRGEKLKVIGTYRGELLDSLKDLDGEALAPAKFAMRRSRYNWEPNEEPARSEQVESEGFATTEHLGGDRVMIVPHELAMSLEGRLRSLAIVPRAGQNVDLVLEEVKDFLVRAAVIALVSDGKKTHLLTSIGAVSVTGTLDLILPLLLVGLIVLNTMMGSVHERVREIAIFSSVGLAPVHIGALFFAESFVVAIVGVVLGYLVSQFVAAILLSFGSLSGLSLNYSSSAAVGACLLVIAAVMLSTIYPARKASELAVPDVTRRWKLPEPHENMLVFDFPFTVGEGDMLGLFAYLADLFRAYRDSSIGSFACDRVSLVRTRQGIAIVFDCWLAPYDLGISQSVRMETVPMPIKGLHKIHVTLARLSGEEGFWHKQNRGFLTALRKRFMVWRMFGDELKNKYRTKGNSGMEAVVGA